MTNIDLAEAQPSFLRRTPTKDSPMPVPSPTIPPAQAQTPAAKSPKQKRHDALMVTIKVSIPVTDRASLDAAYEASDAAKAASAWPAGSVIVGTTSMGKV